ncbi:MAG: hypothetical protein ABI821_00315 [Pseudomonadota bacterium]
MQIRVGSDEIPPVLQDRSAAPMQVSGERGELFIGLLLAIQMRNISACGIGGILVLPTRARTLNR